VTESDPKEQIQQVSLAVENAALKTEIAALQHKLNQRRIGVNFLAKKGYPIPKLRVEDSSGWDLDNDENYVLHWGGSRWVNEDFYTRQKESHDRWRKDNRSRWNAISGLDNRIQALKLIWKRYLSEVAEGKFDEAAFSQSCVASDIKSITQINDALHARNK
jgi:hypothetical protein